MTLEEQIVLMKQQAESKVLPFFIRQNLLAQIAVLEQQNVAAPAAVPEKEHVPFSIKRKKKEA